MSSAVSVLNLTFSYGRPDAAPVLNGVDLDVSEGSVAALVGPNGSGKSTLLKAISGYLRPAKGKISICGFDPHGLSPAERSALVTYCGDEPEPAFDFTVRETVLLGRVSRGRGGDDEEAAGRAMRQAGVFDLRSRAVTSLSSGERQRAYIARALYQDPKVYLLDEPTAHLDMAYELQVMDLVRGIAQSGRTVLAVVHDLNLALRFADKLFFLKDGRIAHAIAPQEIETGLVREIYSVDCAIAAHPTLGCPIVMPTSRV